MAGNNPRKFKDRIALLNQKQAESTEQFEKVMRDVEAVRKPVQLPFDSVMGQQLGLGGEGLAIPRHHPHYRCGGSLPNVNQMAAAASAAVQDMQNNVPGLPSLPPAPVPSDQYPGHPHPNYIRETGSVSPQGGGAIRNRSAERRWDNSPYGTERSYYSSSLVSTYLSPPPESRWRRTHSDSALYQKLAAQQQQQQQQQGGGSEQGSPVQEQGGEDVKPSAELLSSLLQREGGDLLPRVKEEPPSPHGDVNGGPLEGYSPPQLPPSPHSPLSPSMQRPQYLPPSGTPSPLGPSPPFPTFPSQGQQALEQEFQRFRLDPPPGSQHYTDMGQIPHEHNTGPTSPHTPTTLPDIYIQDYSQDWAQECDKGLLDRDFVDTLREGLEPIDDQLMAELTRLGSTGTFVDPAVEEQFKMNY